jgi:hypothetical protein
MSSAALCRRYVLKTSPPYQWDCTGPEKLRPSGCRSLERSRPDSLEARDRDLSTASETSVFLSATTYFLSFHHQITKGISAMLDSLPFRIGSTKAAKAKAGQLSEYDRGAVELRRDEFLCVAAGNSLPRDKIFKQLKFPEQIAPSGAQRN